MGPQSEDMSLRKQSLGGVDAVQWDLAQDPQGQKQISNFLIVLHCKALATMNEGGDTSKALPKCMVAALTHWCGFCLLHFIQPRTDQSQFPMAFPWPKFLDLGSADQKPH